VGDQLAGQCPLVVACQRPQALVLESGVVIGDRIADLLMQAGYQPGVDHRVTGRAALVQPRGETPVVTVDAHRAASVVSGSVMSGSSAGTPTSRSASDRAARARLDAPTPGRSRPR